MYAIMLRLNLHLFTSDDYRVNDLYKTYAKGKKKSWYLYQFDDRVDLTDVTKYSVLPLQSREQNLLYLVRIDLLINEETFTAMQEKKEKQILLIYK